MYIFAIANQKGGCGKTTTTVNLGASLAHLGKKVLVIDFDPQAHASVGIGVDIDKAKHSIYDVLSSLSKDKVSIDDAILQVKENLSVIPSDLLLTTLEQELSDAIGRESRLADAISSMQSEFDYVLIDCPPNLGFLTINALRAANEVIIPLEMSFFSFNGVNQLLDVVSLVNDRLNHNLNHSILMTMFDSRLQYSYQVQDEIKERFGDKVATAIIHINVKLREAASHRKPALYYDKYCRGTKDYLTLAREIITRIEPKKPLDEGWAPKNRIADKVDKTIPGKAKKTIGRDMPERTVEFVFPDPNAKDVYVAGDFNSWRVSEDSKLEKRNGMWVKNVTLPPGRYRYRFVVDGKWVDDPNNPVKEKNPYGELDSLLNIG